MEYLFSDQTGKRYSEEDVYRALMAVGADDCETLFIHSDLKFGSVAPDFNRNEFLCSFYKILMNLHVRHIIVPTFTYSFCNHEVYDVVFSPTTMGAFNEFMRRMPNRYRTLDPLLSLSVPQELRESFTQISNHSLGVGSGLDIIHHMPDVKFLFLGARLYDCFTYLHYVEKIKNVPYRFDIDFTGIVKNYNGDEYKHTQYIHTACSGVILRNDEKFENYLLENNFLKRVKIGNSFISCISEIDAYREINNKITDDPCYFLEKPFIKNNLTYKYTYDHTKQRITHC